MDIEDVITQLEEVFEGEPWYGPSVLKSLDMIPVALWNNKVEGASHTIAELLYHMIDWRMFVIEKLKENELFSIEMNSEKDWRKHTSISLETEKKEVIDELRGTQDAIKQLLMTKPDTWMYEFVDGKDYKNEYMIMGGIQHDIYHLGQINFVFTQLKKIIPTKSLS